MLRGFRRSGYKETKKKEAIIEILININSNRHISSNQCYVACKPITVSSPIYFN